MKAGTNSPLGDGDGESVEHQEQHGAMLTPGESQELSEESLSEEDWGGAESDRPDLDRLRAAAASGEIQAIFISDHSRLSRSPLLEASFILDELREAGVDVQFLGDDPADAA